MTVLELIAMLQQFPQDMLVISDRKRFCGYVGQEPPRLKTVSHCKGVYNDLLVSNADENVEKVTVVHFPSS